MRYVCLVYMSEHDLDAIPDKECMTFSDGLRDSGSFVAADALQRIDTATTVRVRNGKVSITDGPFAETKEQLAGFYVIEARTLDEVSERSPDDGMTPLHLLHRGKVSRSS
jgi:hypothetical protein